MEEETDITQLLQQYPSSYYEEQEYDGQQDGLPADLNAVDNSNPPTAYRDDAPEDTAEEVFPGWHDDAVGSSKEPEGVHTAAEKAAQTQKPSQQHDRASRGGRLGNRPADNFQFGRQRPHSQRPFGNSRGQGRQGSGGQHGGPQRLPGPPHWQPNMNAQQGFNAPPPKQTEFSGPHQQHKLNPAAQGSRREQGGRMPALRHFQNEVVEPPSFQMPMDMPSIFKMPPLPAAGPMLGPSGPVPNLLPAPPPLRGGGPIPPGMPNGSISPLQAMGNINMGRQPPPPDMMGDKEAFLPDYDSAMPRGKRQHEETLHMGPAHQRSRTNPPMQSGPSRQYAEVEAARQGRSGRMEGPRQIDELPGRGRPDEANWDQPGSDITADRGRPGDFAMRAHPGRGDMHMGPRGRPLPGRNPDRGLPEMQMGMHEHPAGRQLLGREHGLDETIMGRPGPAGAMERRLPHPPTHNTGQGFHAPPHNPEPQPQAGIHDRQLVPATLPLHPDDIQDVPFQGVPIRLRGIHGNGSAPHPPRAPPPGAMRTTSRELGPQQPQPPPGRPGPLHSLPQGAPQSSIPPHMGAAAITGEVAAPLKWVRPDATAMSTAVPRAAGTVATATGSAPGMVETAPAGLTKLELERKLAIVEAKQKAQEAKEKDAVNRELQAKLLKAQEEQIAMHKKMIELMEKQTKQKKPPARAKAKTLAAANGSAPAASAAAPPPAAAATQQPAPAAAAAQLDAAPAPAQQPERPASGNNRAVNAAPAAAAAPAKKSVSPTVKSESATMAPSASASNPQRSRSATPERSASAASSDRHKDKKAKKHKKERHHRKEKSSKRRREDDSPVGSEHAEASAQPPKRPLHDDPRLNGDWAERPKERYFKDDEQLAEEEFMALPANPDDHWGAEQDDRLQVNDLRHILRRKGSEQPRGEHEAAQPRQHTGREPVVQFNAGSLDQSLQHHRAKAPGYQGSGQQQGSMTHRREQQGQHRRHQHNAHR